MGTAGADATRAAIVETLTEIDALSADDATDALMDRIVGPLLRERVRLLDELAQAQEAAASARDLAYDQHGDLYRDRFRNQMKAGLELVERMRTVEAQLDEQRQRADQTERAKAEYWHRIGELEDEVTDRDATIARVRELMAVWQDPDGGAVYSPELAGMVLAALAGADGDAS